MVSGGKCLEVDVDLQMRRQEPTPHQKAVAAGQDRTQKREQELAKKKEERRLELARRQKEKEDKEDKLGVVAAAPSAIVEPTNSSGTTGEWVELCALFDREDIDACEEDAFCERAHNINPNNERDENRAVRGKRCPYFDSAVCKNKKCIYAHVINLIPPGLMPSGYTGKNGQC